MDSKLFSYFKPSPWRFGRIIRVMVRVRQWWLLRHRPSESISRSASTSSLFIFRSIFGNVSRETRITSWRPSNLLLYTGNPFPWWLSLHHSSRANNQVQILAVSRRILTSFRTIVADVPILKLHSSLSHLNFLQTQASLDEVSRYVRLTLPSLRRKDFPTQFELLQHNTPDWLSLRKMRFETKTG